MNCFHIHTHTVREIRVFRVVAVQKSNPLFVVACGLPGTHELRHFFEIHKGHVIDMAVVLAVQDDCRRETLIAHTFRVRLVLFAAFVYLVANL
jgi:hypothetical protein